MLCARNTHAQALVYDASIPHRAFSQMPPPFTPTQFYVAIAAIVIISSLLLGLFLSWAWVKFFNFLGRNEIRDHQATRKSDQREDK
jgi:NhaP-type Na+/H+ or K+/H+ antiporter